MKLPKNLLEAGVYTAPQVYLCETDRSKIGVIPTMGMKGTFKFNSYSEIEFNVPSVYTDEISGEVLRHPYYDKIEALRTIYLGPDFGYFEIEEPIEHTDGIKEYKEVTAYSLEYTLSQKYLENFWINSAEELDGSINDVTFYNINHPEKSLLHLVLRKAYGWTIGAVAPELYTKGGSFTIDRMSIYDFLTDEVSSKFNCYFTFDTVNLKVNAHIENQSQMFKTRASNSGFPVYYLPRVYKTIGKITATDYSGLLGQFIVPPSSYSYDNETGALIFKPALAGGLTIEVTDGAQSQWDTDIYVSFDNLAKEAKVSYSADDIKTVLHGYGADDLEYREVNMGSPYVTDLSFYHTVDWMGQELYDAYEEYLEFLNDNRAEDIVNRAKLNDICLQISDIQNDVSTHYTLSTDPQMRLDPDTILYVRDGGSDAHPLYREATQEEKQNPAINVYYELGVNLTDEKLELLWSAISYYEEYYSTIQVNQSDEDEVTFKYVNELKDANNRGYFDFITSPSLTDVINYLDSTSYSLIEKEQKILEFLMKAYNEYGTEMLKIHQEVYSKALIDDVEYGYTTDHDVEYPRYHEYHFANHMANYFMINAISAVLTNKQAVLDVLYQQLNEIDSAILAQASDTDLTTYFINHHYEHLLPRLVPLMREDEYRNDGLVVTDATSDAQILIIKEELRQQTLSELNRISQPRLEFTMGLANLFALPEFEPIHNKMQLGNFVRVELRPGYMKKSRLMEVEIDFDKFNEFSCKFGELTSVKSVADIHADLLKSAATAGKSVAQNESYWNKSANKANEIDMNINAGLLDAIDSIKSIDGTQSVEIDRYGIHLRKLTDGSTMDYDPKQVWLVNNKIIFTDDNWKTTKTVIGNFTWKGQERYGLLADAVVGGLVVGSEIEGGTIRIGQRSDGEYNFEVDQYGNVTMRGGEGSSGGTSYDLYQTIINNKNAVDEIQSQKMYRVEVKIVRGQNIFTSTNEDHDEAELRCYVYSWDEDITNKIPTGSFNWKRDSQNPIDDEQWNQMHVGNNGPSITITDEDVTTNATFYCNVNILD